MTDRALLQQTLVALELNLPVIEDYGDKEQLNRQHATMDALRERLAQPEQEPVAWANESDLPNFDMKVRTGPDLNHTVPLYTAPPKTEQEQVECMCGICKLGKREWVGLTNEEIKDCEKQAMVNGSLPFEQRSFFARAVEAKLKEKNT